MGDLLALQNEVTSRLANAFSVGLISAEDDSLGQFQFQTSMINT